MLERFKERFTVANERLNGQVAMVAWIVYFVVDGVSRLI